MESVATKSVQDRRPVRYQSLDDLLADARQLASSEVEMLGNWSLGQILKHLAAAYEGSIDGLDVKVPWLMKVMAKLLMKKKFLEDAVPPGFKITGANRKVLVAPDSISTDEGLAALEKAVERLKTETTRANHPVFDRLSVDEWNAFHLRHAEMHMSFARPVTSTS